MSVIQFRGKMKDCPLTSIIISMTQLSATFLAQTSNAWDNGNLTDTNESGENAGPNKVKAHRDATKLLKDFAKNVLKLSDGSYDVRSNKAGTAVSGEVTLHAGPSNGFAKGIYIQVSQPFCGVDGVLFRSCTSMKDYTGGFNNFATVTQAFGSEVAIENFAERCRRLMR